MTRPIRKQIADSRTPPARSPGSAIVTRPTPSPTPAPATTPAAGPPPRWVSANIVAPTFGSVVELPAFMATDFIEQTEFRLSKLSPAAFAVPPSTFDDQVRKAIDRDQERAAKTARSQVAIH